MKLNGFHIIDAKKFATNYVELTTSKHCFIYHIGYYLEMFSGIERLGNYSVEGNIKWIKKALMGLLTCEFV